MSAVVMEASDPSVASAHFDLPAFGRIKVSDTRRRELLMPLLAELRDESCGHSWQPILAKAPPADAFDVFERIVTEGRPGCVFTYYRETAAGDEAMAVGVVSDGIAKDCAVDGLPVLGRAFVRPAYRRKMLYPAILRHRLDYCRRRWGSRLLGVHLGTAAPGVERSFRQAHRGRVVFLGDEDLGDAGMVRALLGLTDDFERHLHIGIPPALGDAHVEVMAFLCAGAGAKRISAVTASLERLAQTHAGFAALRLFLAHLPMLR